MRDLPRRQRHRAWKDNTVAVLGGLVILVIVFAGLAYAKFQWTECRKDPDHTFWHCVQVMD